MTQPAVIELTEYQPRTLSQNDLPLPLARQLQQQFGPQVRVERQWAAPGEPWRLTAQGWVGHLPLSPELALLLQPKTPLENLFGMLEVAYRQPFRLLDGVVQAQSLPDFFERLAHILARQVLHRARQGVQRAYVGHTDRLPAVRGRLLLHQAAGQPGQVQLPCTFEEHTADTEDNRILLVTLWLLLRAVRQPHVRRAVEQAYRALPGQVRLEPLPAAVCLNRRYHRLNEDYRPMHALCYFFLDRLGPAHRPGQRHMLPFLVDMAQLFELFVAEWLRAHCPTNLRLRVQAPVNNPDVKAVVDVVLVDADTGQVRYVLDTKYKVPTGQPSEKDIYQVVAYAQDRHCPEAVLIYPAMLSRPLDTHWGGSVRVRSLTFALDGHLETTGRAFLKELLR